MRALLHAGGNAAMVLAAAVLCAAGAATAQSGGERMQGAVEARGNLVVRTERGNVQVRGQAGATQVRWTAEPVDHGKKRSAGDGQISCKTIGDRVELRSNGAANIDVIVPARLERAALYSGGGDLKVADISGSATLITDGGQISIENVPAAIDAHTGGGNIVLRQSGAGDATAKLNTGGGNILIDAALGDVNAATGGGNIEVTAAKGSVHAADGGGNVIVRQAGGGVHLDTAGGNVEMGDIGGDVYARSGGGGIKLASARGAVRVETGAGAIECRQMGGGLRADTGAGGILAEFGRSVHFSDSKLITESGDVTVWLPENLAAVVKATAENPWGHAIRSEFSAVRLLPKQDNGLQAEGLMNGGGPMLRIQTDNGNIELLKLK